MMNILLNSPDLLRKQENDIAPTDKLMINLLLGVAWFLFGVAVFVWVALDPEKNSEAHGLNMYFVGGGAIALALYNTVRWWLSRPRPEIDWMGREFPPRKPPRVEEYNPDLDFSKGAGEPEAGIQDKGESQK